MEDEKGAQTKTKTNPRMPLKLCVNSQNHHDVVDHGIQPLFSDFTLDGLIIPVEFLLFGSNQGFWGSFAQWRGRVAILM